MDLLSPNEVEMCHKAVEIQSLVKKPVGLDFNHLHTSWDSYGRIWFRRAEFQFVWIPYQEDLQLIANHESPTAFERIDFIGSNDLSVTKMRILLNRFNSFVDMLLLNEGIQIRPRLGQFNSIRQLWLAFAMQRRYGKNWNGDTWIKVKQEVQVGKVF